MSKLPTWEETLEKLAKVTKKPCRAKVIKIRATDDEKKGLLKVALRALIDAMERKE